MRRVLAILWFTGVANAQPVPPPSPDVNGEMPVTPEPTPAEAAFLKGRELLDAGDFAGACASFETSLKEDPNAPGTLLNLGLCNERLGKTATALAWFRKAQFRSAETGMTEYEDVAKNNTISLAARVPTLKITYANPPPSGGIVFLDERQLSEIDLARIEVDPNVVHAIELRVQGKPPIRTEITVKDGDELTTVAIPVPAPPKVTTTVIEVDRGKTRRIVAYSLAGVGVGLMGASLLVTLDAKQQRDSSERPEDWAHARDVARWGGTSLFVGGALAIATASVIYFTAPGVERVERTTVAPVVAAEGLGLVVHGSF